MTTHGLSYGTAWVALAMVSALLLDSLLGDPDSPWQNLPPGLASSLAFLACRFSLALLLGSFKSSVEPRLNRPYNAFTKYIIYPIDIPRWDSRLY